MQRPCSDIAVDFTGASPIVYAGVFTPLLATSTGEEGIWQFKDGNWQQVHLVRSPARGGVIALAASSDAPPILYARIEDARARDASWTGGDLVGVFRSPDGLQWDAVVGASAADEASHYGWFNSRLIVDPDDSEIVYVSGVYLHRYRKATGWLAPSINPAFTTWNHRDQHCMAIVSSGGQRWLYVGNDGGLDRLQIPAASAAWPANWDWQACDHGLNITEFYDVATQSSTTAAIAGGTQDNGAPATAIAGGTQDNGAPATFGNRTWLYVAQCDAGRVAMDAAISSTIYEGCVGPPPATVGIANPIARARMQMPGLVWNSDCLTACPPVAAHPLYPGIALASQCTAGGQPAKVLELGAGTCWRDAGAGLDPEAKVRCLAIGGASPDTTYYVGFAVGSSPSIWSSSDGGTTWNRTPKGLPGDMIPTRVAMDDSDPRHAYASFGGIQGGDVYVTTDAGASWNELKPKGRVLPRVSVHDVAISPDDPNDIFVATEIGIFRGDVTPGAVPTVDWQTFDQGLPDGVDVPCLEVNRETKMLIAGTLGYGAYECAIRETDCPKDRILVRDNVFDRGGEPSPQRLPNPEDPIVDTDRSTTDNTFYKYNDIDPAGLVMWWDSEDIRVSVPDYGVETDAWIVDPVSVESCPVTAPFCPSGTIPDEAPVAGHDAHVYVQIHNAGTRTAHNIRVLAIWTDASASPPLLPAGFWATTFPANATACGGWPGPTGWHFFDDSDCSSSFKIVHDLAPDDSRIVTFEWRPPPALDTDHSCITAFVESDEDPIPGSVRTMDERQPWVLVPNHHQIAQRNMQIVGSTMMNRSQLMVYKTTNTTGHPWRLRLLVEAGGLPPGSDLEVLGPAGHDSATAVHFTPVVPMLSASDNAKAEHAMLGLRRAYRLTAPQGELFPGIMPVGATWTMGIRVSLPPRAPLPARFSVVAARDSVVMGGNTYVLTDRR